MMNKDYAIVVKPRIEISSIDITDDGKYGFLVTLEMPNLKPTLNGIYQYKKDVYTLCNERKNR